VKIKMLSFVFVCFLESGLFNGLHAIQIALFSPRLRRSAPPGFDLSIGSP
jgi:hypothetical protein